MTVIKLVFSFRIGRESPRASVNSKVVCSCELPYIVFSANNILHTSNADLSAKGFFHEIQRPRFVHLAELPKSRDFDSRLCIDDFDWF